MKTKIFFLFFSIMIVSCCIAQHIIATTGYNVNNVVEYASGEYAIFSNNAAQLSEIDKPIIIVEGFDPLNSSSPQQLVDFTYNTDKSLKWINRLKDLGYDIVILNFGNGADYIQKNAFLLIELIQQVNQQKTGNEQLVIIGESMGGLVTRYALTYMEAYGMDHNTRLYISFDTPHKGANVPLALQDFALEVACNHFPMIGCPNVKQWLITPATQQMLVYHVLKSVSQNTPKTALPHDFRNNFLTEINNFNPSTNGYPAKCRNIAIANGNISGVLQKKSDNTDLGPNESFLSYDVATPIGTIEECIFWGLFCKEEKTVYLINKANLKTNNSNSRENILGLTLNNVNLTDRFIYNPTLPYDFSPGSTGGSAGIEDLVIGLSSELNITYQPNLCFIPTISALDYNSNNLLINLTQESNIMCNIPFDAFYAPKNVNQNHLELSTLTANWLYDQIIQNKNNNLWVISKLSESYNFGGPNQLKSTTGNILFNDVLVTNTGELHVNSNINLDYFERDKNSAFAQTPPLSSSTTTPFELVTAFGCNKGVLLEIKSGGKLVLGEANPNIKAVVKIKSGSTLKITNNGKLIINNNSKLIIEAGANLIVEQGANIQLLGDNATIEIKGTLRIGDNADFTFTYPSTTSGFVKLYSTTHIDPGTNSTINLKGKNRNDKVLEINGTVYIPKYLSLFKIEKGNVDIKSMALSIESPVTFKNSNFTGAGSGVINLYGQTNVTIQGSTFDGIPIYALLYVQGNPLTVSSNTIFKNNASLVTYGESVNLYSVDFISNINALQIYTSEIPCLVKNCMFTKNNNAIIYESSNGSQLKLENTTIKGKNITNNYGVKINGGSEVLLECSQIDSTYAGIFLNNSASVVMNTYLDGGQNTFNDNFYSIQGNRAKSLNLNIGYNDLRSVSPSKIKHCVKKIGDCPMAIQGTFCGYCTTKKEKNTRYAGDTESCTNNVWTKNNTWNEQGTPPRPYVDYEITHCTNTNKPITLIDNNPKLPSCGYAPPPPDPGTASEPLDKCTDCIKIMTKDFINERLENAVKNSMSHIEKDPTQVDGTIKNNVKAIDKFHQILTYPIPDPSEEEQYLLEISYHKIMEAFGNSILTGEIPKLTGNLFINNPAVKMVLDVIDKLIISQGNDPDNLFTKTYLHLDRAQIYRTGEQRNLAINEMDNVLTWSPIENHDYINKCKCIYEAEEMVLTNQLPKEDFIEHVKQNCGQAVIASKTGLNNNEEEVITLLNNKTNINEFYISPNPVNDIAVIEYKLSGATNARIIVYDIFGKIIKSIELQSTSNNINLDISDLQNGVYLFKLEVDGNYTNTMKKMVVVK